MARKIQLCHLRFLGSISPVLVLTRLKVVALCVFMKHRLTLSIGNLHHRASPRAEMLRAFFKGQLAIKLDMLCVWECLLQLLYTKLFHLHLTYWACFAGRPPKCAGNFPSFGYQRGGPSARRSSSMPHSFCTYYAVCPVSSFLDVVFDCFPLSQGSVSP